MKIELLAIDSGCLLRSRPKIGIFMLQMIRRGKNCEFGYIKSRDKNKITSLIELESTLSTLFYLHTEPIH